MTINKTKNGSSLTIILEGRLDTTTSPEVEKEINSSLNGIDELVFDLAKLEYISSAGLRVLLHAKKVMSSQGKMIVCGANETVNEVFEITGFSDILDLK